MPPPVRRRSAILLLTAVAPLLVAGAALAGSNNGGLTPQSSESPNAAGITNSYLLIGAVTAAIFVLVGGLLLPLGIGFRRRGRTREDDGPQIHGSTKLELMWTIAPAVLLACIA